MNVLKGLFLDYQEDYIRIDQKYMYTNFDINIYKSCLKKYKKNSVEHQKFFTNGIIPCSSMQKVFKMHIFLITHRLPWKCKNEMRQYLKLNVLSSSTFVPNFRGASKFA